MNISGVILAGGQSSRMGRDKAWLEIDGEPAIARALSTLRAAGIEQIFLSGREGADYSVLQCPVLLDREAGRGPLSGIEQALEQATTPLILVLAVDLPKMTAAFLRQLADHCDALTGAVPLLRGELEPLAALYPRRCRFIARDCLLKSRLAARGFADDCLRAGAIRPFAVPTADAGCFDNWNTPSDVSVPAPGAMNPAGVCSGEPQSTHT